MSHRSSKSELRAHVSLCAGCARPRRRRSSHHPRAACCSSRSAKGDSGWYGVVSSLSRFCIPPTSILAKITAFPPRPPLPSPSPSLGVPRVWSISGGAVRNWTLTPCKNHRNFYVRSVRNAGRNSREWSSDFLVTAQKVTRASLVHAVHCVSDSNNSRGWRKLAYRTGRG